MAGFSPVGSTPVASILGTTAAGVNYQLTAAYFRFVGATPTVGIVIPPIRVSWIGAEVVHPGVALAQVTMIVAEVLRSTASIPTLAQVSWFGAEVLHSGAAAVRATWIGAEVVHTGQAVARVTNIMVEVLRSIADAPLSRSHGSVSIVW